MICARELWNRHTRLAKAARRKLTTTRRSTRIGAVVLRPLRKLGSLFGRSFTILGSLALKLGSVRRLLLLVAAVAAVVILSSLLLTVLILQA